MLRKDNFIQRSLVGAISFLKEIIFTDTLAGQNGFLQGLDPRMKLITFLLIIIQALFTQSIGILLILYALCLFLALFSRINLGFFLKRTWFFIPLFSLFIALPALFDHFSPGPALVSWKIYGLEFVITRPGLSSALIFIMRVAVCASWTVLLSITTRHLALLKVLRIFKVPQIFVMVLGMCYRYLYLFIETVEHTYLAIKSRVGVVTHYKAGQKIVAWNIASLWNRSVHLNEEVYQAMLSRGYKGEAVAWDDFKMRARDWLWLGSVAIILFLLSGAKLCR